MKEPSGFESNDGGSVKRLRKALYGLKQAGRKWYDALSKVLANLGFHVSSADPGVFTAHIGTELLILAVHVDKCILTGSSAALIEEYKQKLNDHYALTDLGPVNYLLGIKITRDRFNRTISLSQSQYIKAILARFNSPSEVDYMRKVPYHEAVGSLMYAFVATHPDITFAVSTLS